MKRWRERWRRRSRWGWWARRRWRGRGRRGLQETYHHCQLDTGIIIHMQVSPEGRTATIFILYHRTRAAKLTMPDADGEYSRMCDSLPQSIAANALEYSKVPLFVQFPWVLLLVPRILRGSSLCPNYLSIAANAQDTQSPLVWKNFLSECCYESTMVLQRSFSCPHSFSLVPTYTWKPYTDVYMSCWNQQNRSPAPILHPSNTRFGSVYRHWYGPSKPQVELCLWWQNTPQLP